MKNKKPNAETLLESREDFGTIVPVTESEQLKRYLKRSNFAKHLTNISEKKLYNFMRVKMLDAIGPGQKDNLVFIALIERIARTAVFLERFDKKLLEGDIPMTSLFLKGAGKSEYNVLQLEHRKCIESLINLKYAYEQKKSTKVLEELRKTIVSEVED